MEKIIGAHVFLAVPNDDNDNHYNGQFGIIMQDEGGSGTTHPLRVRVSGGNVQEPATWFRSSHVVPLVASPFLLRGTINQLKAFIADFVEAGGMVANPCKPLEELAPIEINFLHATPFINIQSSGYKTGYKLNVLNGWNTIIGAVKKHVDAKAPVKFGRYEVELHDDNLLIGCKSVPYQTVLHLEESLALLAAAELPIRGISFNDALSTGEQIKELANWIRAKKNIN